MRYADLNSDWFLTALSWLEDKFIEILFVLMILIFGFLFWASITGPGTICLGGYLFTNTPNSVQILDGQGHGIRCEGRR